MLGLEDNALVDFVPSSVERFVIIILFFLGVLLFACYLDNYCIVYGVIFLMFMYSYV